MFGLKRRRSCDMLLVNEKRKEGSGSGLLTRWVRSCSGPVVVFASVGLQRSKDTLNGIIIIVIILLISGCGVGRREGYAELSDESKSDLLFVFFSSAKNCG